jgi:hypothetical protein
MGEEVLMIPKYTPPDTTCIAGNISASDFSVFLNNIELDSIIKNQKPAQDNHFEAFSSQPDKCLKVSQ